MKTCALLAPAGAVKVIVTFHQLRTSPLSTPMPVPDVDVDEPLSDGVDGCNVPLFCDCREAGLASPLHAASRTGTIGNAQRNPALLDITISSLCIPYEFEIV